jgi:multiple sugar transport system permease protein
VRSGRRSSLRAGSAPARRTSLLLGVPLALSLALYVVPFGLGLTMSLLRLTPAELRRWRAAPFVGLDNYRSWLDLDSALGHDLVASLARTGAFAVLVVAASWLLGLTAALLLDGPVRGKAWWQVVFLLPFALPAFVTVLTWRGMLDRDTGVVNTMLVDDLSLLHDRPFWLVGEHAFWSIVVVSIWRMWPLAYLVLAAALRTVPGELLEQAAVDGASPWRRLRHVRLPLTARANLLAVAVMALVAATDVSTPYLMFDGNPPPEATLVGNLVYRHAFAEFDLGLASALNLMLAAALVAALLASRPLWTRSHADA